MPLFNYTPTKEMAQVTPVNFTTQPNLSFSRAIANLQEAAVAGAQLKDQLDKTKYDKALIEFEQKKGVFNTKWEESDFDTRLNVLLPELKDQFIVPYADSKNKYSRDLYLKATTMANGYYSATAKEGIEDRYRDNEVTLIDNLLAFDKNWVENPDIDYHSTMLDKYDEQFVDPYRDKSDPYSQALLKKALGVKEQYNKTISKERISKKDNVLSSEITDIISQNIALSGEMTPDLWNDILKKAGGISNFKDNKAAYLQTFATATLNSFKNYANALDNNPKGITWDDYKVFNQKVMDFTKLQPQIQGTDGYSEVLNAVDILKNKINNEGTTDLQNMLIDDTTSVEAFRKLGLKLMSQEAISPAVFKAWDFKKSQAMQERNVKKEVRTAIINDNIQGLTTLIEKGHGSSVADMVSSDLETQLRRSIPNGTVEEILPALDAYFTGLKKYKGLPVKIKSSEFIDNVLQSSRNGTMQDLGSMLGFAKVYEKAVKENGYIPSGANKANLMKDYQVIQGLIALNTGNAFEIFSDTRTRPRSKPADIDEVYKAMASNEDAFTIDLNPAVNAKLRSFFEPTIDAMLAYGLDTAYLSEEISTAIDQNFIRAAAYGQKAGIAPKQTLIPKGTERQLPNGDTITSITSEDDYQRVARNLNYVNNENETTIFRQRDTFLMPQDFTNPNGNWVVFYEDGSEATILTPDEIDTLVKTGSSPSYIELDSGTGN